MGVKQNEVVSITLEESAVGYARRGWIVHRIHPPTAKVTSPGKRPIDVGWQKITAPPTKDKLNKWFGDNNPKNYNIGLVCGEASGVTVIDLDRMIFADIFDNIDTLRSFRTTGRGHVFFKYHPRVPASKHHNLGIEVLSTGNNVILPPSVHASGDIYRWADADAPLAALTDAIVNKLNNLFERERRLNSLIKKCRPCFSRLWKKEVRETTDFHGAEGRELMLAWGADLKAAGATIDAGEMWAKIIYGEDHDSVKTLTEWRNIDEKKTWKCATVVDKLGGMIDCNCHECKWKAPDATDLPTEKSNVFNALGAKAGEKRGAVAAPSVIEGQYEVLNYEQFRKLITRYPDTAATAVEGRGETAVYEIVGDDFIELALDLEMIKPHVADDGAPIIVPNPGTLHHFIGKVGVWNDGDDTTYTIVVRGKKIRFGIDDILEPQVWRKKIIQCNLVLSFEIKANALRDAWHIVIMDILTRAQVVWEEEMSGDDLYASLVVSEIQKLVEVVDRKAFKLNPVSFLREDGAILVKTDTVREIVERKKIPYNLAKMRQILREHLVRSSKQMHIQNTVISVWFFKDSGVVEDE